MQTWLLASMKAKLVRQVLVKRKAVYTGAMTWGDGRLLSWKKHLNSSGQASKFYRIGKGGERTVDIRTCRMCRMFSGQPWHGSLWSASLSWPPGYCLLTSCSPEVRLFPRFTQVLKLLISLSIFKKKTFNM